MSTIGGTLVLLGLGAAVTLCTPLSAEHVALTLTSIGTVLALLGSARKQAPTPQPIGGEGVRCEPAAAPIESERNGFERAIRSVIATRGVH